LLRWQLEEELPAIKGEVALAVEHLERAVAKRSDDPIAFVALAGAQDAFAALHGRSAGSEVDQRLTEARASVMGGTDLRLSAAGAGHGLTDYERLLQLGFVQWLWPRNPGWLPEVISAHDYDEPA
jgi:hypothetical protein